MQTYRIQARKGNGPWTVQPTQYPNRGQAENAAKAMNRGVWCAEVITETPTGQPPLPTANHDGYTVWGCQVHFFLETGEKIKKKKGGERDVMMRIKHIKIHVTCKRSGKSWVYTGTKRDGKYTYTDSRIKARGMSHTQFNAELMRMMGESRTIEVWRHVVSTELKMGEYKAMFGG